MDKTLFFLSVLDVGNNDNNGANCDITFTKKIQYCMSLQSLYQEKTITKCQKFLAKSLKGQCIGINIKQKSEKKLWK